ncbi:hypothetical protein [Flagellimonas sp. CMM7]|uniref:hypothetical protein n=1 Tax=Flagellimonas sp. CMM7 TaxID=2654676 RepID=UPI0013D38893|nr:hypothetical protein [Flagellimonas sp. CMM7]UII80815.1 hypothetical protein LV704_04720 [Flagellimonas sp. CMM7]
MRETHLIGFKYRSNIFRIDGKTTTFDEVIVPFFSNKIGYVFNISYNSICLTGYEIGNHLSKFAQLLNPARNIQELYGANLPSTVYFLDYIHRALMGILLYQLIKAFRKISFS